MKANELMLKDWVYNCIADIVFQVYPQFFSQWHNKPEQFEAIIQPIPLTAEILEKNGFKECNKDTDGAIQYELGDEISGVDIWVNAEPCLLGAWRTWAGESQSYSMIDELPIRYVHELQHALRLCGIEKEIII